MAYESYSGGGGYNDYNTTSYGEQGGAGGGGFMMGGSSQSPGNRERNYGAESLRPVTIRQLNRAEQPNAKDFQVDGQNVTHISLIGQIRNINKQSINITYKLDDGTGTIEVKTWGDAENPYVEERAAKLLQDAYVRVIGRLTAFGNKRQVNAVSIQTITDFNEISYHFLEATVVHLKLTVGEPNQDSNGAGGQNQTSYNDGGMGGGGGMSAVPRGASNNAKRVYEMLHNSPQQSDGLHLYDLSNRLKMDPADVQLAAEELLNIGIIYITADEQTWAILET